VPTDLLLKYLEGRDRQRRQKLIGVIQ